MQEVFTAHKCNKMKSTRVGDYSTKAEAEAAMVEHYRKTSKRGSFCYAIWREKLEKIGGVMMRSTDFQKYARYTREMLEAMV